MHQCPGKKQLPSGANHQIRNLSLGAQASKDEVQLLKLHLCQCRQRALGRLAGMLHNTLSPRMLTILKWRVRVNCSYHLPMLSTHTTHIPHTKAPGSSLSGAKKVSCLTLSFLYRRWTRAQVRVCKGWSSLYNHHWAIIVQDILQHDSYDLQHTVTQKDQTIPQPCLGKVFFLKV